MSYTAIFGGTFNPFHIGHYQMLEALCSLDYIDNVYVMPDKIPPHKEFFPTVKDEDRIEMCRIMCEKFSKANLCLVEFEREGKSYSYDTVMYLKNKNPNINYIFVCGGDMINSLHTWYRFDDLKKEIPFLAFSRGDDKIFNKSVKEQCSRGAEITVIKKEIADVSSSMLRKDLNKDLLPPEIYDYIKSKGLSYANQL